MIMNLSAKGITLDPVWEEKYSSGHAQRYPWDQVVTFVMRNHLRDRPRAQTRILEVGCGTGSNLWFAAREGFSVAGIDGSRSAIDYARKRFADENLPGDLRVGDFTRLPFGDASFDLVIDRGALTCCGYAAAAQALAEIRRVSVDGGLLFFNPYSDRHTSRNSGVLGADGTVLNIDRGSLVGAGQICFYSEQQAVAALAHGWAIRSMQHLELADTGSNLDRHCEWRIIAVAA